MSLDIELYRLSGATIGEKMRAFSPLSSAEPYLLKFGNNITISTEVRFITHDNSVIKLFDKATDTFGYIEIGDNCFIGAGSIILPGVKLGPNTIVGAGSVVTKSYIEGNIVIGGNPAKKICDVSTYKNKVENNTLNTRGLTYDQKKEYLLNNSNLFLKK